MARKTHERARIPTDLSTLGARLRYARLCRRYHLALWCKVTGFDRFKVNDWETGSPVDHQALRLMAYFLGVSLEWLLGIGDEPTPVHPQTAAERLMSCVDLTPETRLKQLNKRRPTVIGLPELRSTRSNAGG